MNNFIINLIYYTYNVYCNALTYLRILKKIQNNEFIIISSNVKIK